MDFKTLIASRRSIRKFEPTAVPEEVVNRLVEATLTAPSSRNSRSTHLMIIDNAETIARMAEMRDYGSSFMKNAPLVILVMGDTTVTDKWLVNASISATMLQLSIVEHGLASCWVHVGGRPRLQNEPDGARAEEYLRSFLDIPAECKVECVIALGYSDFEPKPLPEWDSEASILWHTRE